MPDVGQSVYEAAELLIRRNKAKIEQLQLEIRRAEARLKNPSFSRMAEAERVATQSEPFQRTSFPRIEDA